MLEIRPANPSDYPAVWEIIRQVIATGDTYVFDPSSSKEKMLSYWFASDKHTYVAILYDRIVGTFFLKDNQPDLGSHVANAGYMTDPEAAGQGIGQRMGEFSLEEAKRLGYQAMQFNLVVKSNERAVRLWQKLGFLIVGELPGVFRHPPHGLVNAYVMHRSFESHEQTTQLTVRNSRRCYETAIGRLDTGRKSRKIAVNRFVFYLTSSIAFTYVFSNNLFR